ncbi:MAG: amidohydrolase [Actinobacteria bacterium]|nr:amidohydrolase [Actinomycetota bacterium]
MKTVITGATILTADDDDTVLTNGVIEIDGDRIVDVGTDVAATERADRVIDASGMLACPGFINAHTHLCMILGRSLGSDLPLLGWLSEAQVPLMQAFEPDDYDISMRLGAIENIKAGNTTVCEVFFSSHYEQEADQIAARGLDASGIRSVLYRCSNDEAFFDGFVESRHDIVERSQRLIDAWHDSARTGIGIGPLIPWGSSAASFRDAVELSAQQGVGIHLHTAETPEYNDLVRERTGRSNVGMLADVGALGPNVVLNHCVFLDDEDIALIAESASNVIHDPTSNMILASGVAPVPALRAAGVNIGLACDGPSCNNGQDMIEAMKQAALLHKVVTRQPDVLVARDVFHMATRGGAMAVGMADRLGALAPGFLADIVLLDLDAPHLTPAHDPLATLVYSARGSDVHTVLIDGEVILEDRVVQRLDEAEVLARARTRAAAAARRAA